jgi:hypothetical protein
LRPSFAAHCNKEGVQNASACGQSFSGYLRECGPLCASVAPSLTRHSIELV